MTSIVAMKSLALAPVMDHASLDASVQRVTRPGWVRLRTAGMPLFQDEHLHSDNPVQLMNMPRPAPVVSGDFVRLPCRGHGRNSHNASSSPTFLHNPPSCRGGDLRA